MFAGEGGETVKKASVVPLSEPDVAVIVSWNVPWGEFDPVVMLRDVVPVPDRLGGLKFAVVPEGTPVMLKPIPPLVPVAFNSIEYVVFPFKPTEREEGLAVRNRLDVEPVVKLAVYVAADDGATIVCDIAPPSDQFENTYCVAPADCGEVVAIVCVSPGVHWKVHGAVQEPPSTVTVRPTGELVIV